MFRFSLKQILGSERKRLSRHLLFAETCTGVSLETQYVLQYIGVQISDDNLKQKILLSLKQKRKSLLNKVYHRKE